MRRNWIESLIVAANLLFVLTRYSNVLKITSIGKGIAANISSGVNAVGSGKTLKNFDQWAEELSKQTVIQSDERDTKPIGKANELFNDDDIEEE